MADQLSAMPSVHVGWALIVGLGVVHISRSRWRWLALLHPLVTVLVVVVTANHYWMDGILEVGILAAVLVLRTISRAWTQHRAATVVAAAEPEPATRWELPWDGVTNSRTSHAGP